MRGLPVWVLAAAGGLPGQATWSVHWRLPAAPLSFGDRLGVEVRRQWPAGAEVAAFDAGTLAPLVLTLVSVNPLLPAGEMRQYTAYAFGSGEVTWPPLGMIVHHADGRSERAVCTPDPIVVGSALPTLPGDVEWPDGLAAREPSLWPWWLAGGVALLGGLWWWRGRTARVPAPALPAVDATAQVLARLHTLTVPPFDASPALVQSFYRQLAAHVREHAGRHLRVPAATRTSEEVVAAARAGIAPLRACLQRCDAVKFAAAQPDQAAHAAAREEAVAFVQAEAHAG